MVFLYGCLYVVGGFCGIFEIEYVECYDLMINKWFDMSSMNKFWMNYVVVIFSDCIYVVGGSNSVGILDFIEKYNFDLNLWLIICNMMDLCSGVGVVVVLGGEEGV